MENLDSTEELLREKFEYSIAMIGFSVGFILCIYSVISKFEINSKFMDLLMFGFTVSAGALIISVFYFLVFTTLYGIHLVFPEHVKANRLNSLFSIGVLAIPLVVFIVVSPMNALISGILSFLTGINLFELYTKPLYLLLLTILLFILAIVCVRYLWVQKKKEKLPVRKNLQYAFIFLLLIVFLSPIGLLGRSFYVLSGFPTLSVDLDKYVYLNRSDEVAIITVTALAYGSSSEDSPLTIDVTQPSGKPEPQTYERVSTGTYVAVYDLKGREAGVYNVTARTVNQDTKTFILVNERGYG